MAILEYNEEDARRLIGMYVTSDQKRMKRILTAWEHHAADPFLPRTLAANMKRRGFQIELQKIIAIYNPVFEPDTYSNRIIDLIVPFVVEHGNVTKEEAESWATDLREWPACFTVFYYK